MRPVSKIVASLLGLSLLVTAAHAAPGDKAAASAVEPVKAALAKLTLTDEQKTKTDAIIADAEKQADAAVADAKAEGKKKDRTDEEKKAANTKRQEFNKKLRADIDAVLTPEQKKQFKDALAEARKAAKEAKPAAAAAADPAK